MHLDIAHPTGRIGLEKEDLLLSSHSTLQRLTKTAESTGTKSLIAREVFLTILMRSLAVTVSADITAAGAICESMACMMGDGVAG